MTDDGGWTDVTDKYECLIKSEMRDSIYLRRAGLQQNVIDLAGDCSQERVLDVGCGDGWLLGELSWKEGYECDCVPRAARILGRHFSVEDVRKLSYPSGFFNTVVVSLVLMWVEELDQACQELYRVLVPGGRVVVALTHPFFYRTGDVTEDGDYLVTRRYSKPSTLSAVYIGGVAGPLRYFHRTLSDYLNAAIRAGFVLEEMREWSIDLADYAANVQQVDGQIRRTDRVPMYVFFALRKR